MAQIEKTFTITGMSCGGCVNSLTRVLKSVPGIEPITIEVGKAHLRLDADLVTSQVVRDAVERAGFEVAQES
jgi:copper chaperone CopZ